MAKLKLDTEKLQRMLAKASKGASNNKLLAITSMVELKYVDGTFSLTTTDCTNYLQVTCAQGMEQTNVDDFVVVIPLDIFSKLIAKTSSKDVTLNLKDNYLEVTGDGIYKIEIPTEEGDVIKFPSFEPSGKSTSLSISLKKLNTVIDNNLTSVGVSLDEDNRHLTGIYFGKKVLSTDGYKAALTETEVFKGATVLLAPEAINLIGLLTADEKDTIKTEISNSDAIFIGSPDKDQIQVKVESKQLKGKDIYPVDAIDEYLSLEFEGNCTISKGALLAVLDRMSLFVDTDYDDNAINLVFTDKDLTLSSKKSNASEKLLFGKPNGVNTYSGQVDITTLKSQIEVLSGTEVNMFYKDSDNQAIKVISHNLTLLVSLKEE